MPDVGRQWLHKDTLVLENVLLLGNTVEGVRGKKKRHNRIKEAVLDSEHLL